MFSSTYKTAAFRQAWDRSLVLGRQSYDLFRALAQSSSRQQQTSWKDVLMHQARSNQNGLAMSLLSIDREVNRMRYYGPLEYIKKERASLLPVSAPTWFMNQDTTGSDVVNDGRTASQSSNPNSNRKTAKVAFMITSAQRQELTERLRYDAADVKRMTPLEASLILEHSVVPADKESTLPGLVHQYNQALEEKKKEAQEKAQTAQVQDDSEHVESIQSVSSSDTKQHDESMQSAPSDSALERASFDSKLWFELIEERDGNEQPVALYDNEEEATVVLKLKQEFAERDAKEYRTPTTSLPTYKIRQTHR